VNGIVFLQNGDVTEACGTSYGFPDYYYQFCGVANWNNLTGDGGYTGNQFYLLDYLITDCVNDTVVNYSVISPWLWNQNTPATSDDATTYLTCIDNYQNNRIPIECAPFASSSTGDDGMIYLRQKEAASLGDSFAYGFTIFLSGQAFLFGGLLYAYNYYLSSHKQSSETYWNRETILTNPSFINRTIASNNNYKLLNIGYLIVILSALVILGITIGKRALTPVETFSIQIFSTPQTGDVVLATLTTGDSLVLRKAVQTEPVAALAIGLSYASFSLWLGTKILLYLNYKYPTENNANTTSPEEVEKSLPLEENKD